MILRFFYVSVKKKKCMCNRKKNYCDVHRKHIQAFVAIRTVISQKSITKLVHFIKCEKLLKGLNFINEFINRILLMF